METGFLEQLNESQRMAVEHGDGPALVFAGAGSGKTRVLTYRVAYLIGELGVRPYNVLAVTFTNKAAREMKERISGLLGEAADKLWAGTFHGTCARMLRERADDIGLPRDFVIFDDSDQMALVREAMEALGIDSKALPPRDALNAISRAKERLLLPDDFAAGVSKPADAQVSLIYRSYQERLAANHALDFDDLIMYAVMMLRDCPNARDHYQERFHHVLVDEYQDINPSQYQLVSRLSAKRRSLFCVGDDDQSIYRWRGADVGIILQFRHDFPDANIYVLEQNYRSTKKILDAAYHVVSRNSGRANKRLWTDNDEGCGLRVIAAANEVDEASKIARSIQDKVSFENRRYSDMVVLYRINAQSRVFEEAMINHRIPYKLVGTVRFYERKEVKDVLAYLRLAANPGETVSLKRVINTPPRGIGQVSVAKLEEFAGREGLSLFEALTKIGEESGVNARARNAMGRFAETIGHLHKLADRLSVRRLIEEALSVSGYEQWLKDEHTMESQTRLENVQELVTVGERYALSEEAPSLAGFLEQVALVSDIDTYDEAGNAVTLMTLHSAKGLEFPVVYMVGLEESVFPHRRSMSDREEMEEERRLCYVGMTRAREELTFSYAHQRQLMGRAERSTVSRFLRDIPPELLSDAIPQARPTTRADWRKELRPARTGSAARFRPGQKVRHPGLGDGIVLNCSGSGASEEVTVAFDGAGVKRLPADVISVR